MSGTDEAAPVDAYRQVRRYHQRTKHRLDRYAAGPETLDWDAQPDPFRRFEGARLLPLAQAADAVTTTFAQLYQPGTVPPRALTRESLAILFELSLGLAAWKQYGAARWALRCNPSSGNLHPTEGYAVLPALGAGAEAIDAGVYHYASHEHALENRCVLAGEGGAELETALGDGRFIVGLSSIHWREAWKYGERAFRYCQLDTGHAIAAVRYAAAVMGWRVALLDDWSDAQIAAALGLDRTGDFDGAEPERAEIMLLIDTAGEAMSAPCDAEAVLGALAPGQWHGQANLLDPRPFYEWPVIDEVDTASRKPATHETPWTLALVDSQRQGPAPLIEAEPAARLIRQRRSTQAFDGVSTIGAEVLFDMLARLLPRPGIVPWDAWPYAPRIHPVLFVHRVDGLAPGLYALPRRAEVGAALRAAMREEFLWETPPDCPETLPLFHLVRADARRAARSISCHQDIAADGAFSLGMLAEFEDALDVAPWSYRRLYWEAGMLGHVLYLEAEAHGLRGTGIGCFFDDTFHEILGLSGEGFQSLYHFAVGRPLTDNRLITLPPYHHLPPERQPERHGRQG